MKNITSFCLLMLSVFFAEAQYTSTTPVGISTIPNITNWNAFYITNVFTNINGTYVQNPTNASEYDYQGTNGITGSIKQIGLIISNQPSTPYTWSILTVISNAGGGFWPNTNWPASNFLAQVAQTPLTSLVVPYASMGLFITGSATGNGVWTNTVISNAAYSTAPPTLHPQ